VAVGLFLEWSINSTHLRAALLATTEVRCSNGECSTSPGQSLRVATELAGQLGCQFSGNLTSGENVRRKLPGNILTAGFRTTKYRRLFFYISENFPPEISELTALLASIFFLLSLSPWGPDSLNFPNPALPATLICLTMYDYIFLNTITRFGIETAGLAFGGTGLCSYRVRVVGAVVQSI